MLEDEPIVLRMLGGYRQTQMLYVVAKLKIADLLSAGPMSAQELASATEVHAPALFRVMRCLAGMGVFRERADGRFEITASAQPLRSDHPASVHGLAVSYGEPWWWQGWGRTLDCVRTGSSAFELADGRGIFDYLREHPEAAAVFNANMAAMTARTSQSIVEAIDWKGTHRVVDVGGGRGVLLATILRERPAIQGILFDQSAAVQEAGSVLAEFIRQGRCKTISGDVFSAVPPGGDLYILKEIIHDWDDERSVQILRNCRSAMRQDGRLIIVERMIGPPNVPTEGKVVDVTMLVLAGGKERTVEEYGKLLDRAGLRLKASCSTSSSIDVIEAVLA